MAIYLDVPQPCIPGLLAPTVEHVNRSGVARRVKTWKRQRSTARAAYAVVRAADQVNAAAGKETREGQVLRCLAAYWNHHQVCPTALELLRWMESRGENVFDANSVRPRITAMCATGLVEKRGKRPCRVSGQTVLTWGVAQR
jgi:hypothetical protein